MRKKVVCYEKNGCLRYPDGKLVGGRDDSKLMLRNGLWLTSGGRVVKPGVGEYASLESGDLIMMFPHEIESGISMEKFDKRWQAAKDVWRKMEASKCKPSLWDVFGKKWDTAKRKDKAKRKKKRIR